MTRATAGVNLPESVANSIWADAQTGSAVMSLATQMVLPGNGVAVPLITGDATASFVAEGAKKPTSDSTVDNKVITPYKIAVIQRFTDEFRRDANALYEALAARLPNALAREFDRAVFHGPVPGSGFDTLAGVQALGLDGTDAYADLVAIDGAVAGANGVLNGWALAPRAKTLLNGAVDGNGRPLFLNSIADNGVANILGGRVAITPAVYRADGAGDDGEVLGFAGDWTQAFYGTVEGVKVSMSDQAVVDGISLWEHNMFAIRAEVEVGFAVRDEDKFVKIVGANTVA
ncbi:phage major capsid protein [Nocardioides abyssi]|uniref:Phage major capsid protein n=1 Tax=Nocardioides abyssi TaxID=3058370 RepID=A0ABT8EXP5_9ACTN|nr:phage major capsid protein [Nocardioides abyssi]MDN4162946.1 phage major capsid protein [Nocardioides abyssi]